ncbi:hypothetical protein [Denitromonas sp.]|uniref:hypothetical protein n=1 Tax=Denitromonas sp. TaxID=2734609 RepID=UPI002FDD36AA
MQHQIAGLMAVLVIDSLEVVDIEHHHRVGVAARCASQAVFLHQNDVEKAAIQELGQHFAVFDNDPRGEPPCAAGDELDRHAGARVDFADVALQGKQGVDIGLGRSIEDALEPQLLRRFETFLNLLA